MRTAPPPWWGCWDAWFYLGGRRCLVYPWSLLAWVVMWPQVFFPVVLWLSGKESTCHAGDTGDTRLMPESGRSPGRRHANSLQYFGQENSMDRGAWWATVHRITKSWIWLKQLSTAKHEYTFVWSQVVVFFFFLLSRLTLSTLLVRNSKVFLELLFTSWCFWICQFFGSNSLDYMRQKENSGDLIRRHSLNPEIPS